MCQAKPAMTDPALEAAAFCQELLTACKAHLMVAYNTAAKCATAYGKAKSPTCSSYHLCLVAANAKMAAADCGPAQGAAPCNK
jgi:hypothetical protein